MIDCFESPLYPSKSGECGPPEVCIGYDIQTLFVGEKVKSDEISFQPRFSPKFSIVALLMRCKLISS